MQFYNVTIPLPLRGPINANAPPFLVVRAAGPVIVLARVECTSRACTAELRVPLPGKYTVEALQLFSSFDEHDFEDTCVLPASQRSTSGMLALTLFQMIRMEHTECCCV